MTAKRPPKPDFMGEDEWEAIMKARTPEIIRASSHAHAKAYLDSNGEGNTYLTQGGPTLLLTTIGRKSGDERISPTNFMPDGEDVIVVGSIAGLDRHPHWALNLDARPEGWVQVKARKWPVTARKVVGEERKQLWPRLTEYFPLWNHFQTYCDREFFVFTLSPKDE